MEAPVKPGQRVVPHYDQSSTTRIVCLTGIAFSWLFALFNIVLGIGATTYFWTATFEKARYVDVILLAQSVLTTVCIESLGLVHSIILRWALHREGRLTFNSQLRLLAHSRTSLANAWYTNVSVFLAIIVAYASSSLTFLLWTNGEYLAFKICGPALIATGIAIGFQAAVVTSALKFSGIPPTWSSSCIEVAAASLSTSPATQRRPGRCIRSLHPYWPTETMFYPQKRQRTAYTAHSKIKRIVRLSWMTIGFLLPAILVVYLGSKSTKLPPAGTYLQLQALSSANFTKALFFICAIQGVLTLTLHCMEQHVNCSRDEAQWRTASSPQGLKRNGNALALFLKSWESLALFISKALLQWVYGLSVSVDTSGKVYFSFPQLFYLSLNVAVPAVITTVIMFWRHKGPQPVAFGHIQTLVDLIDEWPAKGERLFWGDKGDVDGVAHAGTAATLLPPVRMERAYL